MAAIVGNPIRVGLLTTLLLIPALTGCDPTGSPVAGAGETIESQNADDVSASQSLESGDEEREPKREHAPQLVSDGKPLDLTFDDLQFDIEIGDPFERSLLTEEIKAMDGKQVTIGGYIRPAFKSNGLKSFIFVRDNQECCFGPSAAIYDCILVKLAEGTTTRWDVRPIKVSGTFYLKELEIDGLTLAIFRMKNAKVE